MESEADDAVTEEWLDGGSNVATVRERESERMGRQHHD